jgi:hypothetical protein
MPSSPDEIEEKVIAEIRKRRDVGRTKYGVSMERTDLDRRAWLQHAKEEALDLAIYLQKLIEQENPDSDSNTTVLTKSASVYGIKVDGKWQFNQIS